MTQQKVMHVIQSVHSEKIECVRFLEHSTQIASLSRDHSIKITDLKTQKLLATLNHNDLFLPNASCEFAISPNGMFLAVGGQNGSMFIFNLKTYKLEEIFSDEHNSGIVSCAWDPTHGSRIVSIDESGCLFVWE